MKIAEADRATAELVRLVGQTRRRLWIAAARALAARGESIVAWALVNRLAELGPLTQRELADASAQHPAGVSRQLDELERKGLTARGTDPSDRRRRRVELTPAGFRWFRQTRPLVDYYSRWANADPVNAPKYRSINGTGTVEEITARAFAALSS